MSTVELVVHRDERVAVITRAAPPLNLTTLQATEELRAVLQAVAADSAIRAVVLTAAGDRFFGAGSDLTEFEALRGDNDIIDIKLGPENDVWTMLEELPKPTIAALNGTALGGGLELAMCCDFIIADERAQLGLPEIKLGIFPGDGGPVRLTRRVGAARAKRMMYLGDPVDAQTASDWGLVDEVVPAGTAGDRARHLAGRLAQQSTPALAAIKQSVAAALEPSSGECARRALPAFVDVFHGEDGVEGVRAFLAKEEPNFRH